MHAFLWILFNFFTSLSLSLCLSVSLSLSFHPQSSRSYRWTSACPRRWTATCTSPTCCRRTRGTTTSATPASPTPRPSSRNSPSRSRCWRVSIYQYLSFFRVFSFNPGQRCHPFDFTETLSLNNTNYGSAPSGDRVSAGQRSCMQ